MKYFVKSQGVSKATSKGVWTHCELKQVMRLLRQPDETHPNQKLLMPCAELGVFRCFSAISGWINHTWISFSYRSQNLQKETSFFLLYYFFFNLKNKILKIKTYAEVQKYQTKELNHHLSFKTTFFFAGYELRYEEILVRYFWPSTDQLRENSFCTFWPFLKILIYILK